jgi:katanin p60 ATPase-containing subunit A1
VEGNHIVNIFSFSKAYGMMGWRVGYVSKHSYLSYLDFHQYYRLIAMP